jgi:hypothetical protein
MKRFEGSHCLTILFAIGTIMLLSYLLLESWRTYLPVAFFWIANVLILGSLTWQILKMKLSSSNIKLLLAEIAIACFALHMIFVIPYYGLNGWDPYGDLASTKGILLSGFVLGNPSYVNTYSKFPMIHLLGSTLSLTTNIDLFSIVKWFPSVIDLVTVPLLYLFVKSVFKDPRVALMSTLLFCCLQNHINFSSGFVRETLGIVFAVACLYTYFSARHSSHPASNYFLSITFLIGTIFAHHLTSFMLIIILLVHFLVTKISSIPFFKKHFFGLEITGEKIKATYILLAITILLSFWVFAVNYPLKTIASIGRSILIPTQYGDETFQTASGMSSPLSISTIRGNILFYGFFFFLIVFCLVLLFTVLHRKKNSRIETYSFTIYLFFCLFVAFLGLYIISVGAYPDRLPTYGWLLGFPPLVLTFLKVKYSILKALGILLLVGFMFFNIFMIDPSYWNAENGQGTSVSPTKEDYALTNAINIINGSMIGNARVVLAIYDAKNSLNTVLSYDDSIDVTKFNWIVINKPELNLEKSWNPNSKTIVLLEQLAFSSNSNWSKIYESNNLVVVRSIGG